MGINRNYSSHTSSNYYPTSGNPNPSRYNVKKFEVIRNATVALIHYPDCNNYEGDKILVIKGDYTNHLMTRKSLDPHFSKTGDVLARFVPTDKGWEMAVSFAKLV